MGCRIEEGETAASASTMPSSNLKKLKQSGDSERTAELFHVLQPKDCSEAWNPNLWLVSMLRLWRLMGWEKWLAQKAIAVLVGFTVFMKGIFIVLCVIDYMLALFTSFLSSSSVH